MPSILVVTALLHLTASLAGAQSMYLDGDGDGRNSSTERIPRLGWSQIDVWLDTSANMDGSRANLAAGSSAPGVVAYSVLLQGGVFDWGAYTPADPSMRVVREQSSDSAMYYVEVDCRPALPPGKLRLGRLALRPKWGAGTLSIAPCGVSGDTLHTWFKATRDGPELRLGPTVVFSPAPTVVAGEWHDAEGLAFGGLLLPSARPVRSEGGVFYLGWNRIPSPYELRIVEGRAVINGLALPEDPRLKAPRPEVPNKSKADFRAGAFAGAVLGTFHRLGYADSIALGATAAVYRLSGTVDSVIVGNRFLTVYQIATRNSPVRFTMVDLPRPGPARPWPDPEELMADRLSVWDRNLRKGCLIEIEKQGGELYVGRTSAAGLDRSIQILQTGRTLSTADSTALERLISPKRWDAIRHPVRLEKVRP
jgi:hypothetical protein